MTHPTDTSGSGGPDDLARKGAEARDAAQEKAQEARASAAGMAGEARERAASEVRERTEAAKDRAGGELGQLAEALNHAADEIEGRSAAEPLIRDLAGGLDSVSRALREMSPEEMADAGARFARRNPALFLGGAALAGFALSRFATARRPGPDGHDGPGGSRGGWQPGYTAGEGPVASGPEVYAAPPADPVPGGPGAGSPPVADDPLSGPASSGKRSEP